MRPIALSPESFVKFTEEYRLASHCRKQTVLSEWAERANCSPGSLRNALYRGFIERPRQAEFTEEKRTLLIEAAAYVESIMSTSASTKIALSYLIETLEAAGRLPKGEIRSRELSLFMRTYRIGKKHRVTKRFRRSVPNGLHQIDFSVSDVLRFAGEDSVQIRSNYVYENRPNEDRLRVWIGLVVDDASGMIWARYYLSRGESTSLVIKFMRSAWESKPEYPFWGVPESIYVDQASWGKTEEISNLLEKIGVTKIPAPPSSPWKKGKVEGGIRIIKQELEAVILNGMARGVQLSLDKVNGLLTDYCKTRSLKLHSAEKGTRLEYWRNFVPNLWFPSNYDELAFKKLYATVRRGYLTYQNKDYFAPELIKDGTKVELIKLDDRLYIYVPGTRYSPAKRLLLEEARENRPVPVYENSERMRRSVSERSKTVEPFTLDEVERVFDSKIPADMDWTPPPSTSGRKVEGPGLELMHENAQRDLLAEALGPLGDLPEQIRRELVDPFCSVPHSRIEIKRQTERILDALGEVSKVSIEEILRSNNEER